MIARFAAISIVIMLLVMVQAAIVLYWDLKVLTRGPSGYKPFQYYKISTLFSAIITVASVVSNIYYTKFPRSLHRAIQNNDEYGANNAFAAILASAWIYLFSLIIMLVNLGFTLVTR